MDLLPIMLSILFNIQIVFARDGVKRRGVLSFSFEEEIDRNSCTLKVIN